MSFWKFFSRQAANPSGLFGKWIMPLVFDRGNSELNAMMKSRIDVRADEHVLEIGCGTGELIRELASVIVRGRVDGVEVSEVMASIARKRNQAAIDAGRVAIHLGDFDELDLGERAYDAVCSCNTIYFWPDPVFTLKKVRSLLRPGGRVIIAFENATRLEAKPISREVFRFYSQEDVKRLLRDSGFPGEAEVDPRAGESAGLCCAVVRS
jgi:SAM-dependent methyltransferase